MKRAIEGFWEKSIFACIFLVVFSLAGCGGGGGGGENIPTTGSISGTVTDAKTQLPLPGVTVQVSKTGFVTVTDNTNTNGSYTITLPNDSGYVIKFSKTNYHEQTYDTITVKENSKTVMNALLQPFDPGISGLVKSANDNTPLSDVSIQVSKPGFTTVTGNTDTNGAYTITLPNDNGYRVDYSKQGYINEINSNASVQGNRMTFLETVKMLLAPTPLQGGKVDGIIVDAVKGKGVDNVLIDLRAGINTTTGPPLYSTTTPFDNTGKFIFDNVTEGNYTAEISKDEFNTTYITVTVLSGQTTAIRATITQKLASDQTRIILTWGYEPGDLDSHLTGPLDNTGTRFHMYFPYAESKGGSPWPTYVKLDLDDTDRYGPETTTIYKQVSGTYRFSVHNFSSLNDPNVVPLSQSGAQVRVYIGNNLVQTFDVPADIVGNLWTVFEMNGIEITPINTFSFEGDPANIK